MSGSEALFKEAHAAAAREVADLERALWAATHLPGLIEEAKRDPAADQQYIERAEEALRLARDVCDQKSSSVEVLAMEDFVAQLRSAAGRKLARGMTFCANCGSPVADHCDVHIVPCCPGKCPGRLQPITEGSTSS